MSHLDQKQSWRQRLGWLTGELLVVFAGVSAAFGAPHPPAAAWNSALASGVARVLEPNLRRDLGYFYSELVGIHDNYDRYNQFTEREVLPRSLSGAAAFYGPDGQGISRSHELAERVCRRSTEAKQYGSRPSRSTRSRSILEVEDL